MNLSLSDDQVSGLAELLESGAAAQAVGVVQLRQALAEKRVPLEQIGEAKRQIARSLELQAMAAVISERLLIEQPEKPKGNGKAGRSKPESADAKGLTASA